MRILLFGKGGQVGWELQRSLSVLGELTALDFDDREMHADFSSPERLAQTIEVLRPDVIVNAAAHTAVDKAEGEPHVAWQINSSAPQVLAMAAEKVGALLVHYSTDYVFDGAGDGARNEMDPTGPLNVYGRTKLEGEQFIQRHCARHLIFRTSWVYGAHGSNFAKTMLRLAAEREELKVVADQVGAPTGADLLADVTAHAIRQALDDPSKCGLYHVVAAGETSWHGYAEFVVAEARASGSVLKAQRIHAVSSDVYPTAAVRPLNSRLSTQKVRDVFGCVLPDWRVGVARLVQEII